MTDYHQERFSNLRLKPLALGLAFALAGAGVAAIAQTPVPGVTGGNVKQDAADTRPPLNGYAENLKPKVKHTAAVQNQPYQPIKKQEDQAQIPEIEMFVGESRVFPAPGVARIAVGNGQILSAAALDNKEVILFANAVGTSSLFVWNEDGRYQRVKINIVPGDTSRFAREIAAFLTTIPHAKASIIGDKVIVEGDNLSDLDIAKIDELAKRYPQIVNFTDRLGWEQMVMMDVKVVEFPVDELREIGLKWSAVGGAAVGGIWAPVRYGDQRGLQIGVQTGSGNPIPITNADGTSTGIPLPSSLNMLSAVNLGLNAQLNMLAQNGRASILAEPQLAARSGSKASFLAGGEFPYSVSNTNGVTIIFKPYGIKLDIQPKVDRNGMIRATIESEVSKIDPSVSTVAGPALLSRKTNTEFNVRSGETMVLSGLIQVDSNTNIDKVPLLGDIPVLGALFRSKRFQNKETELVVFVTPTVVNSRTPGLVERVERTTERLQQNLGKQPPYLSDPLQPGRDPAKVNQASPKEETPAAGSAAPSQANATGPAAPVIALQPAAAKTIDTVPLLPPTHNPLKAASPASTGKPAFSGGSTLKVKRDGLVIRAEPDAKSAALMQLGLGSVVQMSRLDPQPPGISSWRHVTVGDIQGWVESRWVEPSKLQPVIQPGSRGTIANVDRQGAIVGLGKPDARVAAAPAQAVTADPASVEAGAPPAKRYRVNLDGLALRVTPDINAPIVEHLTGGAVVEALPQPPQGYWLAVQANGKRGWAASQWLALEQ